MKKEIRVVDEVRGIVRVTCPDERWYVRPSSDPVTGLPTYDYVPSVTWICDTGYVKGIAYFKWLAEKGWDEAEAIKVAAGDKGSKVHQAISMLLDGQVVGIDAAIVNPSTGQPEPVTLEEYDALRSFALWHDRAKPVLLAKDVVVWNDAVGYAGTE